MKKHFFYSLAMVGAIMMASCGGSQTNGGDDTNDTLSTSIDSTCNVQAGIKVETDANFFDLMGKVKSCTVSTEYNTEAFSFDEEGKYTELKYDMRKVDATSRDEQGRISSIDFIDELGRGYRETYEYDEQGRIKKASCDAEPDGLAFELVYSYDEKGRIISKKGWMDGPGPMEYKYKYTSEDEQGNWTVRDVLLYVEDETEPNVETETRDIKYWK